MRRGFGSLQEIEELGHLLTLVLVTLTISVLLSSVAVGKQLNSQRQLAASNGFESKYRSLYRFISFCCCEWFTAKDFCCIS
jgi:hypothetical protein